MSPSAPHNKADEVDKVHQSKEEVREHRRGETRKSCAVDQDRCVGDDVYVVWKQTSVIAYGKYV